MENGQSDHEVSVWEAMVEALECHLLQKGVQLGTDSVLYNAQQKRDELFEQLSFKLGELDELDLIIQNTIKGKNES